MHVSPKHFYCSHISSHLYSEVKYFKIQCVYMCICLLVYVDAFIMFTCVCVYTYLPKVLLFLLLSLLPAVLRLIQRADPVVWGQGSELPLAEP